MGLRKKLTLLFLLLIASLIFLNSFVIYLWFAEYRKTEFYDRLHKKANSVVKLLIDVEEIDATLLKKIEDSEPGILLNYKIIIFNEKMKLLYTNDSNFENISRVKINQIIKVNKIKSESDKGEELAFYFKGIKGNAIVIISAKDIFGYSKLAKLKIILLIVSFVCIIIVYFIGLFFVRRALNPIATIIKQIDKITVSNLNQRISEGNKQDDLAQIAITFNKMLTRLENSFMIQRVFIANASHELKTPLTVITGQLEIALIKERKNEDYIKIIQSVLEDIIDVNNLANRLLLIAQANTGYQNIEKNELRIDEVIWDARQTVKKNNINYSIHVNFDEIKLEDNTLTIWGNDLLLKIAFINLIENACKYSLNNSVLIGIKIIHNNIQIYFKDNGIGIPSEDLNMIFEPFYRGKNALGIKGHGIGLALVKNIILIHNGEIKINTNLNNGTEFILEIPLYNNQHPSI